MTFRASIMEGNGSILKEIDSNHMLVEDTNLISSVDVKSLYQDLFHSLDIATATDLEKLCLHRQPKEKCDTGQKVCVYLLDFKLTCIYFVSSRASRERKEENIAECAGLLQCRLKKKE
jgi:hypothetical protein